jgi:hypothetical protein
MMIVLFACIMASMQPAKPMTELLPGVFVGEGIVEFEGTVAIDVHHPETPIVYLEMFVTSPDSREHESLVVADIKPSILHAALLAASLTPGQPRQKDSIGSWVNAIGQELLITISTKELDGWSDFERIENWVINQQNQILLSESESWTSFVFAGSKINDSGPNAGYLADRSGTLISLTTFGDEVISPSWAISHEAEIDEPVWIASIDHLPPKNTLVKVRNQTPPDVESHEPDRIDIDRDG